jgi:hypothetical protein
LFIIIFFTMKDSSVQQVKMSGEELKQLQQASGLSADDFAEKHLKMSRSKFLKLCEQSEIPTGVEALLSSSKDQDLVRTYNKLVTKGGSEDQLVLFLKDTMTMLQDSVQTNKQHLNLTEKAVKMIEVATTAILEDNALYRKMFGQLVDSGQLTTKSPVKL